jgi:uncharacterized membrane protein
MSPIKYTLRRRFLAGLFVLIPGIITVSAIFWLFRFVDGLLSPFLDDMLGYHVSGLGFITAVVIVFIAGFISTNVFGKRIINLIERLFLNIPVFKGIYTAFKQLVDAFSPENNTSFKKFVIVEYPKQDAFAFGFLTKECTIRSEKNGRESCLRAVYIPTNNLYLGEIVLFREGDVFYTDLSIEEGIRIILSGGIATPSRILEATE